MTTPPGPGEHRGAAHAGVFGELGLSVDFDERGDLLIATARGVIDFSSSGPLQEELHASVRGGTRRLVLDLDGVTFVDSTGLGLLLSVQRRTRAAGGWLRLVNPRAQLRRMLRATNLEHHFETHPSVESALAAT